MYKGGLHVLVKENNTFFLHGKIFIAQQPEQADILCFFFSLFSRI